MLSLRKDASDLVICCDDSSGFGFWGEVFGAHLGITTRWELESPFSERPNRPRVLETGSSEQGTKVYSDHPTCFQKEPNHD